MNSDMFFEDRVLFFASWFENSFNNNACVKDMVYNPYSLSHILRINSVGSSSEITCELNSSLNSSKLISGSDLDLSSSISKCNSLSTFINLLTIDSSSIENYNNWSYLSLSTNLDRDAD